MEFLILLFLGGIIFFFVAVPIIVIVVIARSASSSGGNRAQRDDEIAELRRLMNSLERLENRVGSLETILIEKERARQYSEGESLET